MENVGISAAVKKAVRYDIVQSILRHYECPPTCQAHCCSKGQIHMFEDEMKILLSLDPARAGKITGDTNSPSLYLMQAPCSFLNDSGRCHVYERRPTVCGLYPFKVNTSGISIGLQPCPVGFLIIRDFALWMMDTISKTDLSAEERSRMADDWQKDVDSYELELSGFHIKPVLMEMQIPYDDLEMLSMFLGSRDHGK
jgi:Fe-S-cluster containining protein